MIPPLPYALLKALRSDYARGRDAARYRARMAERFLYGAIVAGVFAAAVAVFYGWAVVLGDQ